jgi:hypothetical protein
MISYMNKIHALQFQKKLFLFCNFAIIFEFWHDLN